MNLALHRHLPLFLWLTPLVAQGAPVAQAPGAATPTVVAGGVVPVHTRADETDLPYGVWAAGRDYKASFHDGMTFVPYLGADYPHNQPFGWRTTSVRVGAVELLEAGREPVRTTSDHRVEYAHGAVVEAYDVLAEGLEQTFVLATRPAASGDLRITGTLGTALTAAPTAGTVTDVVFHDHAGVPIVRYGKALAIDADGDRFAVTTSHEGDRIELRLAAADLAVADFPLVVDPLLTVANVLSLGSISAVGDTDIATELVNGNYNTLLCYTRHASAADSDVVARITHPNLLSATVVFSDATATASAAHARCAFVSAANRWVIAYENRLHATQLMQVRAHVHTGGSTSTNYISVPHLVTASTHEHRPVVGGTAQGTTGTRALVAFQRETGTAAFANVASSRVWFASFDPTTTNGTWGSAYQLFGSNLDDAERPAINRSTDGDDWLVVAQIFGNTIAGDDWDLTGRMVDVNGNSLLGSWLSSLGTMHKLAPKVDGRGGRYCVTFSTASTSSGKVQDAFGFELRCERLDWVANTSSPDPAYDLPAETLQTSQWRVLEPAGIAFHATTRSHWDVVYRSNTTASSIYAARVGYRGKLLHAPDLVYYQSGIAPGLPGILRHDDYAVTTIGWQIDGLNPSLLRREFQEWLGTITFAGTGCSSGSLAWDGPSPSAEEDLRIGGEFGGPRFQGGQANDLHLLLVASDTASVPLVDPIFGTNCTLLVPPAGAGYLGTMPLAIGADPTWQLPLPESLPPMTIHLQDWELRATDGLLRGSRRMTVTLTK